MLAYVTKARSLRVKYHSGYIQLQVTEMPNSINHSINKQGFILVTLGEVNQDGWWHWFRNSRLVSVVSGEKSF